MPLKSVAVVIGVTFAGLAVFPYSFVLFDGGVLLTLLYWHARHFTPRENDLRAAVGTLRMFAEAALFSALFSYFAPALVEVVPLPEGWAALLGLSSSTAAHRQCISALGTTGCPAYLAYATPVFLGPFIYLSIFFKRYSSVFQVMMSACKYPTGSNLIYFCAFVFFMAALAGFAHYDNFVAFSKASLHPVVDTMYYFVNGLKISFSLNVIFWSSMILLLPLLQAVAVLCVVSAIRAK